MSKFLLNLKYKFSKSCQISNSIEIQKSILHLDLPWDPDQLAQLCPRQPTPPHRSPPLARPSRPERLWCILNNSLSPSSGAFHLPCLLSLLSLTQGPCPSASSPSPHLPTQAAPPHLLTDPGDPAPSRFGIEMPS
jgi:hypothetical protein